MNDVMNVVYLDSPTTHTSSSIPLRTLRVCMCVCVCVCVPCVYLSVFVYLSVSVGLCIFTVCCYLYVVQLPGKQV